MSKVSVIGLGAMGLPMAKCLVKAGFEVTGFDLNANALAELEGVGGRAAASAAAAAQASDILLVMVVNADQAEAVLFADGGLNGLTQGQTVIASCTMAPDRARAIGEKLAGYSVGLLDAPVSGGTTGAASGTLAIMAAGPQAVFDTAKPVLEAVGRHIYHVGKEHGQGSAVKLVNQLLCGVHIAAAAEAMALGARAGIDPNVIYEVIGNAAGSSWMFKDRVPRMLESSPEVKSAVDIFVKDLGIVLDFGHESRFPLPLSALAHQLFMAASGAGLGREDDSQVRQVYDMMTGAGPKGA
jgi:3-hydroxyisobutyrate dehydrogenase